MMDTRKISSRRDFFIAFVVLGGVLAALTWKTWRKWPDLMVDFGAQLYIPWQISTGAVMGRDFHYLPGGPLSQYYHALLFKIFGVSFLTLAVSNLVVLTLLLVVVYLCFRRCADQLTALTACVAVLTVFAFAHYGPPCIFNYITPYCAEAVHGLVLSALAVALLARWIETANPWLAGAVGLCGGLTLLTKPDLFVALFLTVACGAGFFWRIKPKGIACDRSLALMVAGGLLPAIGFFLWFLCAEGFGASLRAVFGGWIPLLTTSAARGPYYQWCLGLDRPSDHLRQIFLQFLGVAGIAAVTALTCWRKPPLWLSCLLAVPLAFRLITMSWNFDWTSCGYALPLICLTLLALLLVRGIKSGWDAPVVFVILWTIWSLAVMAKMGVFCRIWHYGFALAMPAFVSALYFFLWALPRQLENYGVRPALFRCLLWLMLLPGLVKLAQHSLNLYSYQTMPVGSGADTILAFDPSYRVNDAQVAAALQWVETNALPGATLAVLPEGATLNYLSRRPNPCTYIGEGPPPELAAFGQKNMTDDLIAHSPDYLIEQYENYHDYGETYFGQRESLGLAAQRWIDAHYQFIGVIGHDWVADGQFGIKIYERYGVREAATDSPREVKGQ